MKTFKLHIKKNVSKSVENYVVHRLTTNSKSNGILLAVKAAIAKGYCDNMEGDYIDFINLARVGLIEVSYCSINRVFLFTEIAN